MDCRIALRGAMSGRISIKTAKSSKPSGLLDHSIFAISSAPQGFSCVTPATASARGNQHPRFSRSRKFFHLQ